MITLNHYRVAAPAVVSLATAKVNIMNLHFVRAGLLVHAPCSRNLPLKSEPRCQPSGLGRFHFPPPFHPISHPITAAEA